VLRLHKAKSIKALAAAAAVLVVSLLIVNLVVGKPHQNSAVQPPADKVHQPSENVATVVYGLPVRLKIPKINVDAPVGPVGLTKDGHMEAPANRLDVGWYKIGSRPGNNGTAVLAGHYGQLATGEGSVFDSLHTLEKGDSIFVEDENKMTAAFVVRESKSYRWDEEGAAVFNFSSDGKSYLNLITCQGTWNEKQASYSNRLVVFADKQQ
jgi:sortase A